MSASTIQKVFPNIMPLELKFYTNSPYKENTIRRAKIIVISGVLSNYPEFNKLPLEKQLDLIVEIERECHNYTVRKSREINIRSSWQTSEFVLIYNTTVMEKARELDYTENKYLVPRYISGELSAAKIIDMSIEDMNPELYGGVKKYIEERKNQTITSKTSMLYECSNCGKKECILQSVQIRSLDEGKDVQATCVFCGNMWITRN